MGYRSAEKDAERDQRALARERLEVIALVGAPGLDDHRKRAARAAEEERSAVVAQSRLEERQARERIRDSLAGNVHVWRGVGLTVGLPFAAMGAGWLGSVSIALGVAAGALVFAAVVAAFAVPPILMARERRWLAGLPFEVEGYWTALAANPEGSQRRVTLRLRLADDTANLPRRALLEKLVARGDGTLRADTEDGKVEIVSPAIEAPVLYSQGDVDPYLHHSGKPMRMWLRAFITRILLPLHDAHPIASVEIRE